MLRDDRVLEFEGAERLAEAHLAALETPDIDAVVVRGISAVIGQDWVEGGRGDEFINQHNLRILYEHVPQLTEADDAVKQWWTDNPCGSDLQEPQHDFAVLRTRPIYAHLDPTSRGPVTSSIRVDNTSNRRYFYAHGLDETTIVDGEVDYEALDRISRIVDAAQLDRQSYISQLLKGRFPSFSKIDQRPGDWVVFPNHPHPTLHAVTQDGPTRSIVTDFSIEAA